MEDTRVDKETNSLLTASPLERFKAANICSPDIDINIVDILSNAEGKREEKELKEKLRRQQIESARLEMERQRERELEQQQRGKKAELELEMDRELLAVLNELKEREDALNREEPQTNTP